MIDRQLEGGLLDGLADDPPLQAARANQHRLVRPIGSRNLDPLQVRLELPLGDAGHLGADAAQVLGFTSGCNLVSNAFRLVAEFALGHRKVLGLSRLSRRIPSMLETSKYSHFPAAGKATK